MATSATTALQDPHKVQARPSLIAQMRKADLVICTGAGLEAGWLPLLLRRANNPRVQPGQAGYLEAATAVALLDARSDSTEPKAISMPREIRISRPVRII